MLVLCGRGAERNGSGSGARVLCLADERAGRVRAPASKSQAHRLLICAALGEGETELLCDGVSGDIAATADCLRTLSAGVKRTAAGFRVSPVERVPERRLTLRCGESGTTLRFLLPLCGALGARA